MPTRSKTKFAATFPALMRSTAPRRAISAAAGAVSEGSGGQWATAVTSPPESATYCMADLRLFERSNFCRALATPCFAEAIGFSHVVLSVSSFQ